MSTLRIEGLSKEFVGVVGRTGAGKTTLLNLLTGVYLPSAGRIWFGGRDLTGLPAHGFAAAGIGRTFQNLQIFANMTALENVMTGRHLRDHRGLWSAMLRTPSLVRTERECRARALQLLRFVGLAEYADAGADSMPYGALKRLEIARALAGEPKFLLLDEPAAGLNPTESMEVAELIRTLADQGTTVVLVEHNMKLVMGVSDHIVVLDYGRKLCEGTADEVRSDPRVIEAYLGASTDEVAHA